MPLKECDHRKQVLGVRIPRRAKHAHQALRRPVHRLSEFGEPHRGVDEIAEYGLAGFDVAGEKSFNRWL